MTEPAKPAPRTSRFRTVTDFLTRLETQRLGHLFEYENKIQKKPIIYLIYIYLFKGIYHQLKIQIGIQFVMRRMYRNFLLMLISS